MPRLKPGSDRTLRLTWLIHPAHPAGIHLLLTKLLGVALIIPIRLPVLFQSSISAPSCFFLERVKSTAKFVSV
jgi:hypothetical protein